MRTMMKALKTISTAVVIVAMFACPALPEAEAPEIPKAKMTAAASSEYYGETANAINGKTTDYWVPYELGDQWLRLDLGGRYAVERFDYQARQDSPNGRIKDYEIYVTDADSPVKVDWGAAATTGTWPDDVDVHKVVIAGNPAGRYLILFGATTHVGYAGAAEVWAFGTPAPALTRITEFSVSPIITSDKVEVKLAGEPGDGVEVAGYMVSQKTTPPEPDDPGWKQAVDVYTISDGTATGPVCLYGWVKDNAGKTHGKAATVLYLTAPEIPKKGMTATVSSSADGSASGAIDEDVSSFWAADKLGPPQWLKIDLGAVYVVNGFVYLPRPAYGRINSYSLFVTQIDSEKSIDWGIPAASGSFSFVHVPQYVPIKKLAIGRYVFLVADTFYDEAGAAEVWIYGSGAK